MEENRNAWKKEPQPPVGLERHNRWLNLFAGSCSLV